VPPRDWRIRVQDILDAIERVQRHVSDHDLARFTENELVVDAVSYCFGIIGEAARHVPDEIAAAHPEYFGVTLETLWKTASEDLPGLVEPLRKLLTEP
jgi:uncharacterized protein with HEPN domain